MVLNWTRIPSCPESVLPVLRDFFPAITGAEEFHEVEKFNVKIWEFFVYKKVHLLEVRLVHCTVLFPAVWRPRESNHWFQTSLATWPC